MTSIAETINNMNQNIIAASFIILGCASVGFGLYVAIRKPPEKYHTEASGLRFYYERKLRGPGDEKYVPYLGFWYFEKLPKYTEGPEVSPEDEP